MITRSFVVSDGILIKVACDEDIVRVRRRGRELANTLDFSPTDVTLIITALSELARNIVLYACEGEIVMVLLDEGERQGIVIVARDEGPGIPDVAQVLNNGPTSGGALGLGLAGTKRIMDEFEIKSEVGKGTRVTIKKWVR